MNNKGLTLTELIVASIMIGIVMLGVVSFNYTVGSLESTTNKATQIKTKSASAMLQIKKDVQLATGDITNPGFYTWDDSIDKHSFCIRHDISDPASYNDDQWVCYWHGNSFGLYRFVWDAGSVPTLPCESASPCGYNHANTTQRKIINLAEVDSGGVTTNAYSIVASIVPGPGVDNMDYIELIITTRYIHDQASDPLDNPEYTLKTRVNPMSHSR